MVKKLFLYVNAVILMWIKKRSTNKQGERKIVKKQMLLMACEQGALWP